MVALKRDFREVVGIVVRVPRTAFHQVGPDHNAVISRREVECHLVVVVLRDILREDELLDVFPCRALFLQHGIGAYDIAYFAVFTAIVVCSA